MVHAASGQLTEALAAIEWSLAWYDTSPLRFDRARTLLIAGQIHRRVKAKRVAQDLLAEAHREFTTFGAAAWAEQAAAQLARVNLRPAAAGTLTETERRVAELAAWGLTNREVAQQLFLAAKTVEANLARVYRKLGIASRAELAACRMSASGGSWSWAGATWPARGTRSPSWSSPRSRPWPASWPAWPRSSGPVRAWPHWPDWPPR
jgi:DNA-binding CsgD family transcriptional regulator